MRFLQILFFLLILGLSHIGRAQNLEKFEALFILRFIENVDWTKEGQIISIGVLGNSRVLPELSNKVEEQGLNLTVEKVRLLSEVVKYDILFVARGQGDGLVNSVVETIGENQVLIICEEKQYASLGMDISFFVMGDKLRFVINDRSLKSKNIRLSSRLMGFASEILE